MSETPELLKCPLCNATPHQGPTPVEHCQLHGEPFQRYQICCPKQHVRVVGMNREQATAEWNTRPSADTGEAPEMERFAVNAQPSGGYFVGTMEPHPKGLWVRLADHERRVADLQAERDEAIGAAERQWQGWVREEVARKAAEHRLAKAVKVIRSSLGRMHDGNSSYDLACEIMDEIGAFLSSLDSKEAGLGSHGRPAGDTQASSPSTDETQSRESRMVILDREETGRPTVWCDPEIVDLVAALNTGDLSTVASCSGHGNRPGFIAMADGRVLIVATDMAEAHAIEHEGINRDVNGEPSPSAADKLYEKWDKALQVAEKQLNRAEVSDAILETYRAPLREAYRSGQISPAQWQRHIADDPGLEGRG